MSKSILIVICDFLLLSLLALARFDDFKTQNPNPAPVQPTTGQTDPQSDLLDVLKLSLEEERQMRLALDEALNQAQNQLQNQDSLLADRDQQIRQTQSSLTEKDAEARRLAAARAALERQLTTNQSSLAQLQQDYTRAQTNLSSLQREVASTQAAMLQIERLKAATEQELDKTRAQFDSSQVKIEDLNKSLANAQSESRVNQQLLDTLQQDLHLRVQESARMESQIQSLDQARQSAVIEGQKIAGQLQVARTEVRFTGQQLTNAQVEIQRVREEKTVIQNQTTQLAQGVTTLAAQSGQLTQEIRQSRPLNPNTIFSDFNSNRVHSSFQATRKGLFGQTVREDRVANSVLFSHNNRVYAVYHVGETPLELAPAPNDWSNLFGTLRHNSLFSPMAQIAFLDRDPRILISPVTPDQVAKLQCKVFALSKDVLKFEDAVLVGATDNYYGECRFTIDPETPGYMRMEREFLGRIFGKFVPSKGDLVFAKTGELIGMMANKDYCVLFDNLTAARAIRLGPDLTGQYVGALLSQMYYQLVGLPLRLQ